MVPDWPTAYEWLSVSLISHQLLAVQGASWPFALQAGLNVHVIGLCWDGLLSLTKHSMAER